MRPAGSGVPTWPAGGGFGERGYRRGAGGAGNVRPVLLRLILGVVYVAMAVGQLASWASMPGILGAYDAVPAPALPVLAGGLVVAELVCGVWFAARPRSSALAPVWVYTAVSLVWAGLGVQAYARGLVVANCGCFGVYLAQRLSWFVLAQDALLLVYAGLLIRGGLAARRRGVADAPPAVADAAR